MLNTKAESYEVAHEYMIRLNESDLTHGANLKRLARVAGTTPAKFKKRFGCLVGI